MTSVTSSVLPAHVQNQRLRTLCLDFKRGNERIFGIDDKMLGFGFQLQSDSELQRGLLTPPSTYLATGASAEATPFGSRWLLHSRDGQALHHFDPIAREDHEMRMVEE